MFNITRYQKSFTMFSSQKEHPVFSLKWLFSVLAEWCVYVLASFVLGLFLSNTAIKGVEGEFAVSTHALNAKILALQEQVIACKNELVQK